MLTKRQKNSIRGMTAALSCSALLAGFLIYTNISNTEETQPVVFSDILEGAVAYSDENEYPEITLGSDELMETMFSDEYASFELPDDPSLTVTYIPPVTGMLSDVSPDTGNDAQITDDDTTASDSGMPDNPNEITLLSDEIERIRSEHSETSTSRTSRTRPDYSGNAYIYEQSSTSQSSSTTEETPYFLASSSTTTEISSPAVTTTSTSATTTTTTATTSTTATSATAGLSSSRTVTTTTRQTTASPANTSSHTSKTPFTNVGGGVFSNDDSIYITMLGLVNNARKKAGLNELWYSARVHEVCKIRATELSSYYSHTRPSGKRFSTAFSEIGISFRKCGENIAYGRNMFTTPEEVFKAWMESPSHYENIMSPDFECAAFGLSILKVGNDTYYYWAQEFAKF